MPKTPSSDLWIASDCLDASKLLIFRRCENDTWIPNDNNFEFECTYENVELSSHDCPHESTALEMQVKFKFVYFLSNLQFLRVEIKYFE